jgi:hypothetical protein
MAKPTEEKVDVPKAKKATRKSKVVDTDKVKIKRAPSPYIVFCTEKRPEAKDSNPDASFGMLGKILGEMWGKLDEAGKLVRKLRANLNTFNNLINLPFFS